MLARPNEEGVQCPCPTLWRRLSLRWLWRKKKKVHNIRLGLHMPLHVESQVVRAREGALAQVTLKGPVSGVLPEVTGQLV